MTKFEKQKEIVSVRRLWASMRRQTSFDWANCSKLWVLKEGQQSYIEQDLHHRTERKEQDIYHMTRKKGICKSKPKKKGEEIFPWNQCSTCYSNMQLRR